MPDVIAKKPNVCHVCPICEQPITGEIKLPCGHTFCMYCSEDTVQCRCPICWDIVFDYGPIENIPMIIVMDVNGPNDGYRNVPNGIRSSSV